MCTECEKWRKGNWELIKYIDAAKAEATEDVKWIGHPLPSMVRIMREEIESLRRLLAQEEVK
jgi:hypothetical protein